MISLSKHSFTKRQYDLLNKNLNFCLTPGHYNKSILKKDLESFNGKVTLKANFHNKIVKKRDKKLANKEPNVKSKTNSEPKKNHHIVEMFIEAVNKNIVERFSDRNNLPKNNLTDTNKKTEIFLETRLSCYNENRQSRKTCYSRHKTLHCKG